MENRAARRGRPILRQIDGHGLDRIFVVVTRIFGGTKLGVGGLGRAYSATAGEILGQADIERVVRAVAVRVTIPYRLSGALQSLARARGLEPTRSEFQAVVTQCFDVPLSDVDAFVDEVRERTAGQAEIEID